MRSKRKSAAFVREYVSDLLRESPDGKKRLRIFDFDDTLVVTDARIWVTGIDGNKFSLTPGEFAVYDKAAGEVMDFSEFERLINPRAVAWMVEILREVHAKYGSAGLVILSARTSPAPIVQFLTSVGMPDIEVKALNDASPSVKAHWVDAWIRDRGLDYVEFFDDSHKNVAAVRALQNAHPNVRLVVRHVNHARGFETKQEPATAAK